MATLQRCSASTPDVRLHGAFVGFGAAVISDAIIFGFALRCRDYIRRLKLKSIDRCIVTDTKSGTRLQFAETAVRPHVLIVVTIRGTESLVVGLVSKSYVDRTE